jgi:flavin prenyltransferase
MNRVVILFETNMSEKPLNRLIVGVTGASGATLAEQLLTLLKPLPIETHLVVTRAAKTTFSHEGEMDYDEFISLADVVYDNDNLAAPIASGSFMSMGMVIVPCSMNSLAHIALGLSDTLLTRAASVVLKEKRRLVLMPRETPFNSIYLNHMLTLSNMQAVIMPPIPAYYEKAQTVTDSVKSTLGRVLQLYGVQDYVAEWRGEL